MQPKTSQEAQIWNLLQSCVFQCDTDLWSSQALALQCFVLYFNDPPVAGTQQ